MHPQTTEASQRCCFSSKNAQQRPGSNFAWEIKVRAIAAALLGLTLATPSVAQTTPQTQTPSLQQRGQQLLQGLTGDQNRNSEQGAPGTYDRGRRDTARRPNDDREQNDRYGNTQRSYRDQRQPDQGYREPSDRSGNMQRPYQDQRQSDQGIRGQDERSGNTQRPYRDQRQPNQSYRGPAYDPGVGPSPGSPPSRY